MNKISAAIIGGSGYTGGELLRLLLQHQFVEVSYITSKTHKGKPVTYLHPNLNGFTDLVFCSESVESIAAKVDVIFFCLPHGISMNEVPKAVGKAKIIDLSGDFRIKDVSTFEKYYKVKHTQKKLLKDAVYGLPELNKFKILHASIVANPGCYPTGALLALIPLYKKGLLKGQIIVNSVTGSSGSGYKPKINAHHPIRSQNFKAYGTFKHRHEPEIQAQLGNSSEIVFSPHSAPISRGIFTTIYVNLAKELSEGEVQAIFEQYYKEDFFIRIVEEVNLNVVKNTNFCDIGFKLCGTKLAIFSAIDNLVKGASGQAVQNMNLMFGFKETEGLLFPGTNP